MTKDLAKTSRPTPFFQNIGYMPYKHKFSIAKPGKLCTWSSTENEISTDLEVACQGAFSALATATQYL